MEGPEIPKVASEHLGPPPLPEISHCDDPLRDQWASLSRMVGLTTRTEVTGLFSFSGKRPDIVLYPPGTGAKDILCDVITCPSVRMSTTANDCLKSSQIPGFAAAEGMRKKERDWRNPPRMSRSSMDTAFSVLRVPVPRLPLSCSSSSLSHVLGM
jgi:hypothetical protein